MGNHLLENGFALFISAYFFQDKFIYKKAYSILKAELEEQILPDGAHFELSPMYHQIMLFRLLDCVNIAKHNQELFKDDLLGKMKEKAELMLAWLDNITFKSGTIPLFNDSANGIAPNTRSLMAYAKQLGLKPKNKKLKESAYRSFKGARYQLILDVGQVGPSYIPGHAHCDMLSFELYIDDRAFIVDVGTSTYENNARRQLERSTASHNTVQLANCEQSEIWGSFRLAKRALLKIEEEGPDYIVANHDGFKRYGKGIHQRRFSCTGNKIMIMDNLGNQEKNSYACLHFHPDVEPSIEDGRLITNFGILRFENARQLELLDYEYATEFNKTIAAKKLRIVFQQNLTTIFDL